MEAVDSKPEQKRKKRIFIEDEDDDENTSKALALATNRLLLRRCLITHDWGDSLMGQVTLNSELRTRLSFLVREFSEKDRGRRLAPVLQVMLVLNGAVISEPVVTISDLDSIIMRLDKFMLKKSEVDVARILVHWVFMFLKTNYPKAMILEYNMRTFGDDCHPGVKQSFWRNFFKKECGLFEGETDCTSFPTSTEKAEELFREQLTAVNATWVKSP